MLRLALLAVVLAWPVAGSAQFGARGSDGFDCFSGSGSAWLDLTACTHALQAVHDPPTQATLLTRRARAHVQLGSLRLAKRDLDQAISTYPFSADAQRMLGTVLSRLGDAAGAEGAFAQSLALNPRHADTLRDRGAARLRAGRPAEAEGDLAAALALDPADPEALAFLGFALFAQGRYREAGERFDRCEELRYPYVYLPFWRALAHARAGAEARGILRAALDSLPAGEWPRPLVAAFLDPDSGAEALRRAPQARGDEASFYLAAWALSRPQPDGAQARASATRALRDIAAGRSPDSIEGMLARFEIERGR